ncbi:MULTISPECIES: hypothetical protein [Pseudomonas]|jgi:hypothetical protein|nr:MULTISPECIES: hypothetical protein [Pseudomonas]MCX5507626.1 hypothetical protein [Pseudomonas sp. BJa3]MDT3716562.1 hypothetical protein [Pseudomonas soli]MDT3733295.1 hypothetical protein [Pseudomonas soli]MDX2310162.1 hypothetical protein [Pseudomonas sp. On1]MEE1880915.1 hypothetical protein [Pseudomonas soli]
MHLVIAPGANTEHQHTELIGFTLSDALAYDFKDPLSFGAAKLQKIVFLLG